MEIIRKWLEYIVSVFLGLIGMSIDGLSQVVEASNEKMGSVSLAEINEYMQFIFIALSIGGLIHGMTKKNK